MKKLFCISVVFCCFSVAFSQTAPPKTDETSERRVLELPRPAPFKPKLSLQKAIKVMENFVERRRIDTSRHYFSSAKMIYYPASDNRKEPVWFFEWMNDRMILGDYIHILVSMDGKVWQMPTM